MAFGLVTVVLFITERAGTGLVTQMTCWSLPIVLSLSVAAFAMYFFSKLSGGYALYLEKKRSLGTRAIWLDCRAFRQAADSDTRGD